MRISLPLPGSPLREHFDPADLAVILSPSNRSRLDFAGRAIAGARRAMRQDRAIRAVHFVAYDAMGDVHLWRVGCRGGVKRLWKFGNLAT